MKLCIAVGTAVLLVMALFIIVFVAYYQRKQVQQQLALKELQTEYRRKLMEATFAGQEEERRRFARDLHDDIGTMLSVTRMSLKHLERKVSEEVRLDLQIQKTQALLDETMANVRRISRDLVPTTLERFGLIAALEELIEKAAEGELMVRLQCSGSLDTLTSALSLMLFRIAQELINNAIKHAGSSQITVQISCTNLAVQLAVIDNGQGFDLDEILTNRQGGLGLRNIESRLSIVEGHVTFDVAPGRGSRIYVQVLLRDPKPLPQLV